MLRVYRSKNSSLWMSILYIVAGGALLLFPGISVNVFCWAVGALLMVYGLVYLFRGWRLKKAQVSADGELVLGLLTLIIGLLFLSVPKLLLSILPFLLGLILFLTGLGKIPMMRQAFALHSRRKWLFLIDVLVPLMLGVILLFNPFGLVTAMISFFGICLILVGILDLSGVLCGGDLFQ